MGFVLLLVLVFILALFSIVIKSFWEERADLHESHACFKIYFVCVTFCLSPKTLLVSWLAEACDCGTPVTFHFTFFNILLTCE